MTIVAFQGERGAYSEEAIRQFFGSEAEPLPCRRFKDIFTAVEGGQAEFCMLPVRNSTAGSINKAYDLFLDHDLRIWGEVVLRVRHALLAPRGTRFSDIQRVRSHPQALAQCERFLDFHGWVSEIVYDTAGSARDLIAKPEPGVAVIASRLAGQIYGLDELDYSIEDLPHNYTRMFVLGNETPPRAEKNKTSLVFSVREAPGTLYGCLGEFSTRGINLTMIESRPRRDRPPRPCWACYSRPRLSRSWALIRQRQRPLSRKKTTLTSCVSCQSLGEISGSYTRPLAYLARTRYWNLT
jgi:prephenate dehydratase